MDELCKEAQDYINQSNKALSSNVIRRLSNESPKRQMQWLVNPLTTFLLTNCIRNLWSEIDQKSTSKEQIISEPPSPFSETDDSSSSDDMGFGLFD